SCLTASGDSSSDIFSLAQMCLQNVVSTHPALVEYFPDVARWLRCLHCRLTARRSWVQFPHGALLALGGRSSPDLQWAISRAFLCGVCMFSPCSQGVSSNKNPNRKNMQKQNILLSVRDRDGRFT